MKIKSRWPSVTLEPGQATSDAITEAIALVGCREVARRIKLSATTVSMFSQGKLALPMDRVLNICDACELDKAGVWTATFYGRMESCERYYGFRFSKADQDRNGHDRAKVLEAEVKALRAAFNTLDTIDEHPDHQHCYSGEWDDGSKCEQCQRWKDAVAARHETDRLNALDEEKFGGVE